jgi:hypothetical protein
LLSLRPSACFHNNFQHKYMYGLLNDNGACEMLKFYWSGVSIWADKYTNMLPTHDKTSNKLWLPWGGGNQRSRRKQPTCHKSLTNIMVYTSSCSRLQLTTAVVIGTECGSFISINRQFTWTMENNFAGQRSSCLNDMIECK